METGLTDNALLEGPIVAAPHIFRIVRPLSLDCKTVTDIHAIRLRRPWHCRPMERGDGVLRYARRFHRPTGVEPHETIYLAVDASAPLAAAWLNGQPLNEQARQSSAWRRFDVTGYLDAWNALELDIVAPSHGELPDFARAVDAPCEVRMEIHGVGGTAR